MKYPIYCYAKALAEAVVSKKGNAGQIERNFIAILKKNGDESHARKIIEESERFLRRKDGTKKIVLSSARPLKKSPKEVLGGILGPEDVCETGVHPELIAGMTLTINDDFRFDGSLKGKIDKLFNY